jgi:hypothetical protein
MKGNKRANQEDNKKVSVPKENKKVNISMKKEKELKL